MVSTLFHSDLIASESKLVQFKLLSLHLIPNTWLIMTEMISYRHHRRFLTNFEPFMPRVFTVNVLMELYKVTLICLNVWVTGRQRSRNPLTLNNVLCNAESQYMQGLYFSLASDDVIIMRYWRANKISICHFRTGISKQPVWTMGLCGRTSCMYLLMSVSVIIQQKYILDIWSEILQKVTEPLLVLTYYSRFRLTHVMHPKIGWIQEIIDQPDYIMMNWGGFNRFGICQFEIERGMD